MKIKVLGAAGGEVTGSAYLVQTSHARVLIDCGLFQGGRKCEALNRPPLSSVRNLDAVLITHGHLDHTGRLPLLAKLGYEGPVYATPATISMTGLILRDSARVQESDVERTNRKRQRAGQPLQQPLYGQAEVEAILRALKPVPYQEPVTVAPGIQAIWAEAGHMLGSASIQLILEDRGETRRVVFSGDLGPKGIPILRDYEPFQRADLVFLESTYGDHDHRPFRETVDEFVQIVQDAVARKGKILIPTFAVGRAQLVTILLGWMVRKKLVKPFPIFLDSPMAIEANKIYSEHHELFDDEMLNYLRQGSLRQDLSTLRLTATAEESKAINDQTGPCLVMAGSGMCNGGRILHHLKQCLWRKETHVVIVGYQSQDSLGRRLVEGDKMVRIFGEKIAVAATIHTLGGFSAHAGQTDLLEWFRVMADSRPRVVLTHGDNGPREALSRLIQQRFDLKPALPGMNEVIPI